MAALKDKLKSDLTDAMRARDELRTGTLRMALTAVTNEEVSGTQARELDDDEVLKILGREAKKRREASEAFTSAGRTELAEREDAELGVLETYLPAQLDDAALSALGRRGRGRRTRRRPGRAARHRCRHEDRPAAGRRTRRRGQGRPARPRRPRVLTGTSIWL